MDVAAACSGFVYAYSAGQAYIASGMARTCWSSAPSC